MRLLFAAGLQIEPCPLRPPDRPLVFVTEFVILDRPAAGAYLQLDWRLVHDAGVDTFEPVLEKAQLIRPSLLGVKRMEMSARMNAQLLMLAGCQHETFGIAA